METLTFKLFLEQSPVGPRVRIVRARIRGGKVQRRKRVSGRKGYTLRGGTLQRMTSMERLHRKMAARRGARKRRAKMSRIVIKRARSIKRRKAMGIS